MPKLHEVLSYLALNGIKTVSISQIQRRFRIKFGTANRIMNELCERSYMIPNKEKPFLYDLTTKGEIAGKS